MKQAIKNLLKASAMLAFVFGFAFIAHGQSGSWTGPSQNPPFGNVDAPINVGSNLQVKSGAVGFGVDLATLTSDLHTSGNTLTIDTNGVVAMNGLADTGSATIAGNATINGNLTVTGTVTSISQEGVQSTVYIIACPGPTQGLMTTNATCNGSTPNTLAGHLLQ